MSQTLELLHKPVPNRKRLKERNKKFYQEYMKDKKCVKCESTKDLHNHHTNPNDPARRDRKLGIYYLVRSQYSIKTIKEELKRTIVLCRICHSIESFKIDKDK